MSEIQNLPLFCKRNGGVSLLFFHWDKEHNHVESGQGERSIGVQLCDGFGEALLLLNCEG